MQCIWHTLIDNISVQYLASYFDIFAFQYFLYILNILILIFQSVWFYCCRWCFTHWNTFTAIFIWLVLLPLSSYANVFFFTPVTNGGSLSSGCSTSSVRSFFQIKRSLLCEFNKNLIYLIYTLHFILIYILKMCIFLIGEISLYIFFIYKFAYTFDFSTLYTILRHDKVKSIQRDLIHRYFYTRQGTKWYKLI